jgi:hypothetical protein
MIDAPGTTAPVGSSTVPVMPPVMIPCACAVGEHVSTNAAGTAAKRSRHNDARVHLVWNRLIETSEIVASLFRKPKKGNNPEIAIPVPVTN